jgi:hypothetical protein
MKKILVLGILAVLPISSASYGQWLGEGAGGYVARQSSAPTGANGGGKGEPMGFSLLSTRDCWPDAEVGCNATPYSGYVDPTPAADAAPAETPAPATKKK